MALLTHTGYGSQDIASGTQVFDFAPLIYASLRQEEAFIAHLDVGTPVRDTAFYWVEDKLVSNQLTQSGTLATGATTLNVASGHGKRIRVGTVLQAINDPTNFPNGIDNGEQVQVTAIATDALTITRAYGLTADPGTTYAASTIWKAISQTLPENSDIQTDQSLSRTLTYNVTQIFERTVNISRNQIKRLMQGVDDEFYYQLDQRSIELRRELNDTSMFGSMNPVYSGTFPQTTVGDNRTMGGALFFLRKAGSPGAGLTYNNTAEALTPKVLNDLQYAAWKKGANPTAAVLGGKMARVVQGFGVDLIRIVPNEAVRQGFSTLFRTDLGVPLTLIVDGNWGDGAEGTVAVLDLGRARLRPFIDAELFMLVAPTFKDGDAARVLCEWSFEMRNAYNALEAHALHTNLTIPS